MRDGTLLDLSVAPAADGNLIVACASPDEADHLGGALAQRGAAEAAARARHPGAGIRRHDPGGNARVP